MVTTGEQAGMQEGATPARPGHGAALVAFAIFLLMGFGSYMAWQRMGGRAAAGSGGSWRVVGWPGEVTASDARIEMATVLHEESYRSHAGNLRRVEVATVLGRSNLDLTGARLAESGGKIEVFLLCGRIDLRVPPEWSVRSEGVLTVGGFHNQASQGTDPAKVVTLEGAVFMGDLKITH